GRHLGEPMPTRWPLYPYAHTLYCTKYHKICVNGYPSLFGRTVGLGSILLLAPPGCNTRHPTCTSVGYLSQRGKIRIHRQPDALALLGMELAGHQVLAPDRRGEGS